MEWISVKERLPTKYQLYYLVRSEGDIHRPTLIEVSFWDSGDKQLIDYYHKKNDHSWDFAGIDGWSGHIFHEDRKITHWMAFPNELEDNFNK